jgi:hypothetical protein
MQESLSRELQVEQDKNKSLIERVSSFKIASWDFMVVNLVSFSCSFVCITSCLSVRSYYSFAMACSVIKITNVNSGTKQQLKF